MSKLYAGLLVLISLFAMAAIGVLILAAISYFSLVTNNSGMSP